MIYHIATESEWEKHQDNNLYFPEKFDQEGFIHCSKANQIEKVANTFYASYSKIWLLFIDDSKENDFIKYENLEGGSELFPHLYRKLPKESIVKTILLEKKDKEAPFELPNELLKI